MLQSLLIKSIEKNSDVIKMTSLVKTDVEISHRVFQNTSFMIDDLAEAIRENNQDNINPVTFYLTSLKETRSELSAHDLRNDKIAADLQMIIPDQLYKNSSNYKIHLALNLLWIKFFQMKGIKVNEILIGSGRTTFHIHLGEKHGYNNRSFYELSIKNLVRDSGITENTSMIQLMEMVPKSTPYTRLIPRCFLKKKSELIQSTSEAEIENTFEALTVSPLHDGFDQTIQDYSMNLKSILIFAGSVLGILFIKELKK